jgi:cobalamin biosynthesis Mg chelatase CobN
VRRARHARNDAKRSARRLQGAQTAKREAVSMSFTVPIIIMLLTIGLAVLIYWGGFAEERRARKG